MATAASAQGQTPEIKKGRRKREPLPEEYFQAGVKAVWLIFPEFQKVHVYTGPEQVAICKGNAICSAESAIPGFSISAAKLFQKA